MEISILPADSYPMNYHDARAYLDGLQMHKIKLGLEPMRDFLDRVGSPDKKLRFIHVAGTNGKGSVSATLTAILHRAGYRVGLYTSPHLSDVRERFRIGDRYISQEEFCRIATRIREVLEPEMITYFEFCTALALLWFAESELDLAILETGMGGRLDATNVITPLMSIITSISMDHEAYLGTTLTAVAGEKAGIIKEKIPVISSAVALEAAAVIEQACRERHAPLYLFGRDFDFSELGQGSWRWQSGCPPVTGDYADLRCALRGRYQRQNGSVAVAAATLLGSIGYPVDADSIREGLLAVRWPGRMEYLCLARKGRGQVNVSEDGQGEFRCYLLDGAHNPDGVKNLAESLADEFSGRRLVCVWGAMGDKDIRSALGHIAPLVDVLILTRPPGERSASPEQLLASLDPHEQSKSLCVPDVVEAVLTAEEMAGPDDLIVVAGSLYLLGAVRRFLCGDLVDQ
jgi:dihydrofolate synthase / folylpolyglutamate synthase